MPGVVDAVAGGCVLVRGKQLWIVGVPGVDDVKDDMEKREGDQLLSYYYLYCCMMASHLK